MKHIVLIKARKPEKFNYCKFGTYKDKRGKIQKLIDINGLETSGYEMFNAVVSLNINDEYDKSVYEFLKDHPLIKKFIVEDVSATERQNAETSILSAQAVTTASQLKEQELKDFALLLGLDSTLQEMLLRAKIIQHASTKPAKFLEQLNDIDKEHRIFLKKAFNEKLLTKVNGVWKHNTLNIGMTDDQAIVWLKDNGDTYALLKHQLRTGVAPVEETIELEEVEQHPLRAGSAISEIEKEIDNLKK
tara:strand:+ start:10463 stop:11200 length:738 start_codon:yes stop_codon:yes gene_type:complete